jgi:monolysocardiolipin acyltransferase
MILEAEPCPDLVPIWIEGPEETMHEERRFPRFIPRPFKSVSVTFGRPVDVEVVFGDLRERWQELKKREQDNAGDGRRDWALGELSEELKYGEEAVDLRMECTMRVRREVLKVRKRRGWPDEDPKAGWVDTYVKEGPKREGRMDDGSIVKDM